MESLALQIALGLPSGAIFFTLLQRAFLKAKTKERSPWFSSLDLGVALSLSFLFAYLALRLFSGPEHPLVAKDIPGSITTQAILGGLVLGYLVFRKISLKAYFIAPDWPWWKCLGVGFLLLLGIFPFIGIVANLLNSAPSEEQEAVKFFRTTQSVQARFLLAFMAVVVAPVVEEMIFRGLLYRIFKDYMGTIAAMCFTSVLFAAIHGNLPTLFPLVLLAFALTAALEWSGSLLVSIAMHATFNATSLAFIYYESTR